MCVSGCSACITYILCTWFIVSGAQRPRGPKLVMDFRYFTTFFWEGGPTIAGDGGVDSRTMFFYVYNLHSLYALLMGKGPTPKTSRSNTGLHVACIEIVCVEISLSIKVAYIFHFILFFFVFCSRLELLIVRELLKLSKVRMEKI